MSMGLTISRASLALRPVRGYTADYVIHQLVADLFGDHEDRPYLYRVTRRVPGGAQALVLSDKPPFKLEEIPDRPYGGTLSVESKAFAPQLSPGQLLDYETRINATTSVDGKRKDIWDAVFEADRNDARSPHDVYCAYLARRLEGAAEVLAARVTERGPVKALRGDLSEKPIFLIAANVIGTLKVVDPAALILRVSEGLGRAKALGCGLLCLSTPGTVLARRSNTQVSS